MAAETILSNKGVINKDEGDDLTLWDLPIVSEGDAPTIIPVAEKMMPTAESIQEIQDQAYKEAYEAAFQKAEQEGMAQGMKAGHEQGLAEGKKEGYELGLAEGQEVIKLKSGQLSEIISTLNAPLEILDKQVEDELMFLVMSVARHVIRREVKAEPSHVISAVRQAVELLPVSARNIQVHLNPEDAVLVRESLSVDEEHGQRWRIIEDPMLSRGGCNVETDFSRIDATIESRINMIVSQVLGSERESDNAPVPPSQSQ